VRNLQARSVAIKTKICRRFLDKMLREAGQALRVLRQNCMAGRAAAEKRNNRTRGVVNRLTDGNFRLMDQGLGKLRENRKVRDRALRARVRFLVKTLRDKDSLYVLRAYNSLKEKSEVFQGVLLGAEVRSKENFLKSIIDSGYRVQSQGVRSLKSFLLQSRICEQRTLTKKAQLCKRFLDSNLKLQSMALHSLCQNSRACTVTRKFKDRFFQRLYCKNFMLLSSALCRLRYNKLKKQYMSLDIKMKLERLKVYGEAKHQLLKQRALYDFRVALKSGIASRRAVKLFKTTQIWQEHYKIRVKGYYKKLKKFRRHSKWMDVMIWNLTKNSPINFQISFWRTRDIKSLAKPMPAERMVKMKRFGEVLFKNYVMVVARAFWRIERAYEIDVSINSQYMEGKNLKIPDWGAIGGWGRGVASARE
jgi:hypothetical protein